MAPQPKELVEKLEALERTGDFRVMISVKGK
jgi:hypothetical protein